MCAHGVAALGVLRLCRWQQGGGVCEDPSPWVQRKHWGAPGTAYTAGLHVPAHVERSIQGRQKFLCQRTSRGRRLLPRHLAHRTPDGAPAGLGSFVGVRVAVLRAPGGPGWGDRSSDSTVVLRPNFICSRLLPARGKSWSVCLCVTPVRG